MPPCSRGQELSAVLTGLRSLDSVSKAPASDLLAAKLGADTDIPRDMEIDLASFYKNDLAEKIETIRRAVKETRRIVFHYYYAKGEADKLVEPYRVVFRWGDWYVFGFCPAREDFRLYKLRRLWNLNVTDEFFTPREVPPEKEPNRSRTESMTDDYIVTAVYEPAVKYRLVEEYGPRVVHHAGRRQALHRMGIFYPGGRPALAFELRRRRAGDSPARNGKENAFCDQKNEKAL